MGVSLLAASMIIKAKYCWWNPISINVSTSCSHANIISSFGGCFQWLAWFISQPSSLVLPARHRHQLVVEQRPHLWPYSVLAETFRLFEVVCSICSLLSRLISLADSSCWQSHPLLLPGEGCPCWNPSRLVAPGSPRLGSVATPSNRSRRIIVGYAQICCIYEVIVENNRIFFAGKCLHAVWHCFISFPHILGI